MKICSRQGKFEPMRVDYRARSGGIIGIPSRFSLTRRYVVCSHLNRLMEAILMSTHNIRFLISKITLNYPKSAASDFFQRLKNEFEAAEVNEPSVFEPLKFYCTSTPVRDNMP